MPQKCIFIEHIKNETQNEGTEGGRCSFFFVVFFRFVFSSCFCKLTCGWGFAFQVFRVPEMGLLMGFRLTECEGENEQVNSGLNGSVMLDKSQIGLFWNSAFLGSDAKRVYLEGSSTKINRATSKLVH